MMKIYTRTGDAGQTGLFGGERVRKDSARVEAYGCVDELNAVIGAARSFLEDAEVDAELARVQEHLFVLGSDLATPLREGSRAAAVVPRISPAEVVEVREAIDRYQAQLPKLREFVLPGGDRAAALLHLARTVCRRAERRAVAAANQDPVNDQVIVYLNRLSDLLFVLARVVNHRAGVAEITWRGLK